MPCGARVRRDAPNSLRSDMRRIFFRLTLRSSAATRLIHVKSKGRFSSRTRPKHELLACVHRLPRSLAYEPPFSAEGNSTSGKPKRRNRTSSTSIFQKALPVAVLSALFGYFLLQPAKSYSHQLGAAKRRNAFDFVCIQPNPSGASI